VNKRRSLRSANIDEVLLESHDVSHHLANSVEIHRFYVSNICHKQAVHQTGETVEYEAERA
jgi:hypothetical protein